MGVNHAKVTLDKAGRVQIHIAAGRGWVGTVLDGDEVDDLIDALTDAQLKRTGGRT